MKTIFDEAEENQSATNNGDRDNHAAVVPPQSRPEQQQANEDIRSESGAGVRAGCGHASER